VRLSFLTANLICIALVAIDYIARTIRMQCFALGVGARTNFLDIFALNAAGDAASALTPLRAGGEPVRFYGMMAARLSVSDSIAVFAVEGIIEWVVIVAIGGYVGWRFGSEWWQSVHQTLVPRLRHALPFISILVVIGLLAWVVVHRLLPHVSAQVGGTMKSSLRLATRMPVWVIVVGFLLTVVRVLARVLVLVAVMATRRRAAPARHRARWVVCSTIWAELRPDAVRGRGGRGGVFGWGGWLCGVGRRWIACYVAVLHNFDRDHPRSSLRHPTLRVGYPPPNALPPPPRSAHIVA
jgi:hypothetical protein